MAPKKKSVTLVFYPLRLDPADLAALQKIEDDIGIPRAEQCRRAIKAWLQKFESTRKETRR